ncbi:unnamed protein product [Hydatigera taeniaeformis]|uniref:ABC transmembrane type-1 domain-containing protein n=1 Tax=Hydatigena taeniaeformis TaxID=6205 RepID=A0A0R3WWK1_HYDTA|nr:unnamed protein product [Hydatigera taeniaeformis]
MPWMHDGFKARAAVDSAMYATILVTLVRATRAFVNGATDRLDLRIGRASLVTAAEQQTVLKVKVGSAWTSMNAKMLQFALNVRNVAEFVRTVQEIINASVLRAAHAFVSSRKLHAARRHITFQLSLSDVALYSPTVMF